MAAAFTLACVTVCSAGCTRSAPSGSEHVRGTVQQIDANSLTVATSGGTVHMQLEPDTRVAFVVQASRQQIGNGAFVGITSVPSPDGGQRATEVHLFPETMRGTGEGSYDWDLPDRGNGRSRMTNGSVSLARMTNGTAAAADNGTLTIRYGGGSSSGVQTITIPDGIPIVALQPGTATAIEQGARVFVVARQEPDGQLAADRITAGKDGVVPPM
jgi:hypothetical protein